MSDGSRHKGMLDEFHPARAILRLQEVDHGGSMIDIHDIDMYEVHAVFFVRSLALYRTFRLTDRVAAPAPPPPDRAGTRVRVHFVWGEVMDGVTHGAPGRRPGFFLFPLGPLGRASNIDRVYVARGAVKRIERLEEDASRRAAEA